MVSTAFPAVERVSVNSRNLPGTGYAPSISADGRYVAFSTSARLTPDDRNTLSDVYVRDRVTRTIRRVTDDRGGDQAAISANGRFVAYRALDGLTRVRVVDLEQNDRRVAGAIPSDVSNYDRPSDSPYLSADGRYVSYAFRPTPELVPLNANTRGHQVMVTDLLLQNGPRVVPSGGVASTIPDCGRVVISFDGELVVFESKAPLTGDDTNTGSDIYLSRRSVAGSLQRISKPAVGLADPGSSFSPVIAQDGSAIFFLSSQPLSAGDTDGRTTIYVSSNVGGTFLPPVPMPTAFTPLALSAQATVSGEKLAYLGRNSVTRLAIVHDTGGGSDTVVPLGGLVPDAAPVLSGDGSVIAVSSHSPGSEQVFAATVPGVTPRAAPSVTTNAADDTVTVTAGNSFSLQAGASSAGALRLLKIERDGVEQVRSTSASTTFTQAVQRSITTFRARAFNDAWIEGVSSDVKLVVRPTNAVSIAGVEDLTRSADGAFPDGRVNFSGTLRIYNTRASSSGSLRVILTDADTPTIMAFGAADFTDVPDGVENVLDVIDVTAIPAGKARTVDLNSFTSPTEKLDAFFGRGRTVIAYLLEQSGGIFGAPQSPTVVLQTVPPLDENTDLPNGGTPIPGDPNTDANFNPQSLQSLSIVGLGRVGGPARAAFRGVATFNNGNRACAPRWALLNGAGAAAISDTGVLTVGAITAPRTVMVQASFADKQATLPVVIFPLPPRVTVRALPAAITEGTSTGEFRLTRTGSTAADLAVNYVMQGTAVNGTDYTLLTGSAIIPAGSPFLSLPVTPLNDGDVEGIETVVLRLLADPSYQVFGAPSARIILKDDEPLPADQPDLVLRRGALPPVGTLTFEPDEPPDEAPLKQSLAANGVLDGRVVFSALVVNRGTAPQVFQFQGSPGSLGFNIQYLSGRTDVTADVVAGTYSFPSLAPGRVGSLAVVITPTADAPVGGTVGCDLRVFTGTPSADLGRLTVTRVR